ncbi:MAG TPA: 50S ribosomal protein L23 [Firmicutes bacterium]|nr:MAG: 50S ribosomal protein L23 [Candidatus Coatesbacteria bacterium]RLC41962.1 MAG: 50S ribosomal protein L23 [Candidatus Coatesbacteria bacterium]RLC44707.1 MAG: 50S ribosomal protein L23 [Candidatus Coatesbacteria bacterium]HDM43243.1 50S ribosomal protein L23 [Bacillota bacterium]HEC79811.1 50S ribosomal protein L23 [Bacillota bacterium]
MRHPSDILIVPLITEKLTYLRQTGNKYAFKVNLRANKNEVRRAIEEMFGVSVEKVNIMNMRGKARRQGWNVGRTSNWKKAIVTLKEGETIDIFEGVT